MIKYVIKRYELKYIITPSQYEVIMEVIKNNLCLDKYGETTIQSLYYDTDSKLLIRNSIERPIYKEKIRVRSYGIANSEANVFLELKKKFNKIVFKRRILIKEKDVNSFINNGTEKPNQIEKEIMYFCNYYKNLKPSMLLLYDRSAYISESSNLRITFDKNTRYRTNDLNLCSHLKGTPLFQNGEILMEIKTELGYPRWLIDLLNENKIYRTRFSKYGTAYEIELKKKKTIKEENSYV